MNPEMPVWTDAFEFEARVEAGQSLEARGLGSAAASEYELALDLYHGDFLAEDPYEEWPVLARERLRLAYLDALDRLARLHFAEGRYAACLALCRTILARDRCREDAHGRIMLCHSRQGQSHLALRQYQACVEALRAELGLEPEPATVLLAERIRRRELL